MKMLSVAGPANVMDDVICTCLVNEQFHPVEAARVVNNSRLIPFAWTNPWQEPLNTAESLLEKMEIPLGFQDFRAEPLSLPVISDYLNGVSAKLDDFTAQRTTLEDRIRDNTQDVKDLEKFLELPSDLEEIYHLSYVRFRFGRMPRESYDSLAIKADKINELILYPTQLDSDFAYLVYVTPKEFAAKTDNLLSSQGFERMRLTSHTLGTPGETAKMLEEDNVQCQQKLTQLKQDYTAWVQQEKNRLLLHYSYIRFMYGAGEIKKYAVQAGDGTFMLCGWIPAKELSRVKKQLTAFQDVMVAEDSPENIKGEAPPVLLKNNFWARLFQPFTEMYGLPAYNEFDPTFLMAVTYSILFGIMYGDVGQGLVLIALGIFLYKKKGMWLGGILGSVGIFSVIFGFVFGSFFGYEELIPGFHVLESGKNATEILIISAAIGAVTIVMMMVINIINGIRQKDLKKIFFTNNSVAGMIFYLAVVVGAVVTLTTGAKVFSTLYIIFLIVIPVLVMFCQEPLGKLVKHQKDWKPESIGGFIAENFFEMFEVILSFVTNTVSFLRVGAYAICHAGMMLVVYTLAGEPASPIVLVLGNIIVMGIEGLMVCIQVLRLEFYEMFGRFYESGGSRFNAAMIDYTKKIEQ
jgi:V/A-type H+-transporting ATPase subunit I